MRSRISVIAQNCTSLLQNATARIMNGRDVVLGSLRALTTRSGSVHVAVDLEEPDCNVPAAGAVQPSDVDDKSADQHAA